MTDTQPDLTEASMAFQDAIIEMQTCPEGEYDAKVKIFTEAAKSLNSAIFRAARQEQYSPEPKADNDNQPLWADPTEWGEREVPRRSWYIDGLVPDRTVTLLSGDGGVGKSLLALQIAVAGAVGASTLDMKPTEGRVVYLAAEDDRDELHRRLADVLAYMGATFPDLAGNLRLFPMAGKEASLMALRPDRLFTTTPLFQDVEKCVKEYGPRLVVLDTSADVFGGNEIDRVQVRTFVSRLRSLALDNNCAVLLLSHPSVAGMQSGSGLSGSTAWNNSVRSRLYLTIDSNDDDLRVLKNVKSNYAKKGGEIKLRWKDGAFVLDDGKPSPAAGLLSARAEAVFRDLLSLFNRTGQSVSDVTGTNYAPAKMAKHPDAKGVTKRQLADAMQRLLDSGEVRIVMEGPPSRQRKRLILASEDFGPDREAT